MKEFIIEGMEKLSLDFNEKQVDKLYLYINELELWNKKLGFVNAEGRKLVINHIFDSLSGVQFLKKIDFYNAADVGSGAGLPGIPLSIFFPNKKFSLIERSGKKCGFLKNCKELFRLDNIDVIESELEDVNKKFDLIIFRAFRDFNDFHNLLNSRLNDTGFLFAYKGRLKEIDEALKLSGLRKYKVFKVSVPFLEAERNIVIIPRS